MQSPSIHISIARQTLTLQRGDTTRHYPISSSQFGLGTGEGSFKTPLGRFEIAEKIGAGAPLGAIFTGRIPTGHLGHPDDPADLIQTRILWLHGLDPDNANTRNRYIYIHGTNHESQLGAPASHGCIRMRNTDIADLFEQVPHGTPVFIQP